MLSGKNGDMQGEGTTVAASPTHTQTLLCSTNPQVNTAKDRKVQFTIWHGARKHVACLRTIKSLVENMIIGVTKGFLYKMRLVYAHFPINAIPNDDGSHLQIRNFCASLIAIGILCQELINSGREDCPRMPNGRGCQGLSIRCQG